MKLTLVDGLYSIARIPPSTAIPQWHLSSRFFSISKSEDEISIVCEDHLIPEEVKKDAGWILFKFKDKLDFQLTGILSSIAAPLAEHKISIFAVSTFDTDYILVERKAIERTMEILEKCGFIFV